MKKKLIGSKPLYYHDNLYVYPFVTMSEDNSYVISYINDEGILEEFCSFPQGGDSSLSRVYQVSHGYMVAGIRTQGIAELVVIGKGNNMDPIVCERIGHTNVMSHDIVVLSEKYLINKDKIMSLPDGKLIMKLEIREQRGVGTRLFFTQLLGGEKCIIEYYDYTTDMTDIFLVDVFVGKIIKKIEYKSRKNMHNIDNEGFAIIDDLLASFNAEIFDKRLEKINEFHIDNDIEYYRVGKNIDKMYLPMKDSIISVDYIKGVIDKIKFQEYKYNWELIGSINKYMFFYISSKRIGIFNVDTKKYEVVKFAQKIYSTFIIGEKIYIVTAIDADRPYGEVLHKEGIMEVYCMEEEQ